MHRNGGKVIDRPRGLATGELNRLLPHPFKSAGTLGTVLAKMEEEGLVARALNGKRCYEIVLDELPSDISEQVSVLTQLFERQNAQRELSGAPESSEDNLEAVGGSRAEPNGSSSGSQHWLDYRALAGAMLAEAAEILARPERMADAQARLDEALAEVERLRERCRIITDRAGELEQENIELRRSLGDSAGSSGRGTDISVGLLDLEAEERIGKFVESVSGVQVAT